MYDELYDYARVTIENGLRPLKEYYYNNPQDFDPKDANLLDKAFKYTEKVRDKQEKYKMYSEHDKKIYRIIAMVLAKNDVGGMKKKGKARFGNYNV